MHKWLPLYERLEQRLLLSGGSGNSEDAPTDPGPAMLVDVNAATKDARPTQFVSAGDRLFFKVTGSYGSIYRVDSTGQPPVALAAFGGGKPLSSFGADAAAGLLTPEGWGLVFRGSAALGVSTLWVSDGTATGLTMLAELGVPDDAVGVIPLAPS